MILLRQRTLTNKSLKSYENSKIMFVRMMIIISLMTFFEIIKLTLKQGVYYDRQIKDL